MISVNRPDIKRLRRRPQETVAIMTLGCARNTVDSEKILQEERWRGARIASVERASTVIVNTCAFTKEAKEESIDAILDLVELKKRGKIKKIFVYGCLSERYGKELKSEFQDVDGFTGIAAFKEGSDVGLRVTPAHYAYVKVCEGCANVCSFCAIPAIKGPLRSRDASAVLEEARRLEEAGVRELNIIGQDITLYGHEAAAVGHRRAGDGLVRLLEKILSATKIPWVRLLYLHPLRISDDLLSLMAREPRVCPYVDVPVQHASDRILALMRRGTKKSELLRLFERIRNKVPQAALRTSLIVGFPSETQKEFAELCDFVREVRFDKLGVFRFSREEGTPAYRFAGQHGETVKERRQDALMALQQEISASLLKARVGRICDVLVEGAVHQEAGVFIGRSRFDAPEVDGVVRLKSAKKIKTGALLSCRITGSLTYDLLAEEAV